VSTLYSANFTDGCSILAFFTQNN